MTFLFVQIPLALVMLGWYAVLSDPNMNMGLRVHDALHEKGFLHTLCAIIIVSPLVAIIAVLTMAEAVQYLAHRLFR